jgi:glycosyltransferase involved in cell wall biosynthesis
MTPELSICIPTYNRCELLARSLDVALLQSSELPVEICISNNASSDDTEDLLRSLARIHRRLRVENRAQNIGIDRNILAAVRMARGRHVLPIGDDEMFAPGAIASILAALRSQPDLMILNGRYVERGCFSGPRLAENLQGRTITSLLDAFVLLWDKMPLGSFAAPRGYASPRFADRYLGTHHAYSGAVWDFLLAGFKYTGRVAIVCTREPLIEFHRVEKAWAADSGAIHFEQIPRWFDLLPEYYKAAAVVGRREFQGRCATAAQLIHFRAARQISRANVSVWFRTFGFWARLRAHAAALLPTRAAAAAVRLAMVAHALLRAVSRLISTPVSATENSVALSGDAARTSARATSPEARLNP